MAAGRIVEDVPMGRLLENPQHPYARRLVQAGKQVSVPLAAAA
jgi:peptide/nickel transport system ATP-binding protein